MLWLILVLVGFIHYYWSIFKWNTKPHLYTWLIFSILLWVSSVIQFKSGWWWWVYVLLWQFIGCLWAVLLSFKFGTKNISKFDTFILILAIITIILWVLSAPVISVILIIIIDILALIPTIRKSYNDPHSETVTIWLLNSVIFSLSLLWIENYSFLTSAYQIAVILLDAGVVIYLLIRRKIYGTRL